MLHLPATDAATSQMPAGEVLASSSGYLPRRPLNGSAKHSNICTRGFACVAIHEPKNVLNIGSVLRAASCYQAAMIVVGGRRYGHAATDTQKAWRHTPLLEVDDVRLALPKGCVPVAVDLVSGARALPDYTHPERAYYVFGGEDRTLAGEVLEWCRDVVYVPTHGCMNLAATVNVVLYDRLTKSQWRGSAAVSEDNDPK